MIKSAYKVLQEQVKHVHLIRRLSVYEIKAKNSSNMLGSLWEIINPLIQLFVYWFVFENVRQASNINLSDGSEAPYFFWLFAGFILWMFFYKGVTDGSSSIFSRIKILSKMSFPMSAAPSFVIMSHFYVHIVLFVVAIILFNTNGILASVYYLQFLYFIPATVFLVFAISLIMSTLSVIIRDAHLLLNAILRMFIYLSPILWEIGKIAEPYGSLVKLNPLYYLIEGYRAAFFGTEWYAVVHWEYSLYFWGLTLVLFFIGATIHVKFRRHFVDFV